MAKKLDEYKGVILFALTVILMMFYYSSNIARINDMSSNQYTVTQEYAE